jgi:TonB family protein
MELKTIGVRFGRTGAGSPREAPNALAVLALALVAFLAGCAARAPESRPAPPPPPAEYAPQSAPIHAAALEIQPTPIDTAIPSPEYPPDALAANFAGSVVLRIVIDETGRVRKASVVKDPGHGLGEAAMRSAIAHFRFTPGRLHGQPVATEWTYTVTYVLSRR